MSAIEAAKATLPHGYKGVTCHPLVLLNVTDHYNRILKDAKEPGSRRVVGVLLGNISKGQMDVANSFAVPFEEDKKDPRVWFIDHNYLEIMARMFTKVTSELQLQVGLRCLERTPSEYVARKVRCEWTDRPLCEFTPCCCSAKQILL